MEHNQPDTDYRWWVLIAVGLGTFMTALDTSVTNTILPVVSKSFRTDVASVEWVVTVYLLVLSGLLLSFGRLGDIRGHKIIFLTGFGIFITSSALCGLSPNVTAMVIFRALQALGGAMLAANSPAILTKTFPASQRGQALGLQATMTYLGLTAGPSLGGWLATQFSWRAVFYINLPVGFVAFWISQRFIHRDIASEKAEKFDIFGAMFFLAGLVALLLGLNQGHDWGWTSPSILGLLGGAIFLLGIFIFIELRAAYPMLDLSMFQNLRFSLASLSAILNYIGVYAVLFLMPFYLIQGRGLTTAQAGLILTAQPIVMAIIAPISGSLSDRIGTRLPSTLGMALLSGGIFLLSRQTSHSSMISIVSALGVVGLGTGTFISPNNSALMGSAARQRQGIAAGILATARNLGMVLGVGLTGAIFTTILARGQVSNPGPIFEAVKASYVVASVITGMGILTSWIRGG